MRMSDGCIGRPSVGSVFPADQLRGIKWSLIPFLLVIKQSRSNWMIGDKGTASRRSTKRSIAVALGEYSRMIELLTL